MAKVLSSISGNLISAASAGYAPTNSGDVSAIASAYQVVSSTGTQLYAGTAYVTSVNGDALSAARAGNAANAVQATSAWYDGTGRLISALPDAAEVSSIASSYAESAASSKADSSSLSSYALSSDVSGVIDTVSTNSATWASGASLPITGSAGDDTASYGANSLEFTRYDTAGEPDIRTAILSPDSLWMDYTLDGNDHTSMTLNESMLNFTLPDGDRYVDAYTIDTWNSAVDTVANNSASWGQGGVDSATVSAIASSYAESAVSSKADSSALSSYAKSADVSAAVNKVTSMSGNWNTTYNTVFYNSAYWTSGYTTVRDNSASWGAGASLPISGSTGTDSATYDVNGIVYEHEPIDEFDSHMDASISVDRFGISRVTTDGDFYSVLLTDTGLSFTDQDGVHTVDASSIDSWNSAVDTVANNSASWGQGGVDSATVSSIASSYAESAVSSKLDSSASSSFYTTANESGYVGSAYVDSAVSGKMDSSAMTSYALSADVSGTVDLVSTQSANWGGSALALSAGPGVKLEMSGNTLVASTDETVLWSGTKNTTGAVSLAESFVNFEKIELHWGGNGNYKQIDYVLGATGAAFDFVHGAGAGNSWIQWGVCSANDSEFVLCFGKNFNLGGYNSTTWANPTITTAMGDSFQLTKIVGINRTAGV